MTYAETVGESTTHDSEQASELAYRVGTHFLSPNGSRSVQFASIEKPSFEAAVATIPTLETHPLDEVAWLELYAQPESPEKGTPLALIGEPYLAVDFKDDHYEFAPLSTLLHNLSLPIYVSEWLARYMQRSKDYSLSNSGRIMDPRFQGLPYMPSQAHPAFARRGDSGSLVSIREHAIDHHKHLVRAAAAAYPHLTQRYIDRGILKN